MGTSSLQREIEGLESGLDSGPASGRTIDELARIRRDLAEGERKPRLELPNLRIGFECKQRWEDMVGDDRVRACHGCDRPVFNLSAMARDEAERLLATRGLTPCVRFYRRMDGTVMTTDCPTGERREKRRLAVVASSIAAGAVLASPSIASAENPEPTVATDSTNATTDTATDATPDATTDATTTLDAAQVTPVDAVTIDDSYYATMGVIAYDHDYERVDEQPRPAVEWSIWGRIGHGFRTQQPNVLARSLTPPEAELSTTWEAALAADVTVGIAHDNNIRIGAWAEIRMTSGPVAGSELVIEGLPPHPTSSRIGGAGSIVLRTGGNAHVFTTALGVGYVGSFARRDPWIRWARHLVGARVVASVNRSLDDPRDWSATFGLEVEPLGAMRAVFELLRSR